MIEKLKNNMDEMSCGSFIVLYLHHYDEGKILT